MEYQSPDNREAQNEYPIEDAGNHTASPHSQRNQTASPHSQRNQTASACSPLVENVDNAENVESADREERLAAARAKASAAKAAAQRRSSRRSMSSANSSDGNERSRSDCGSEPRSREGSVGARRSSIRSIMQMTEDAERELAELMEREAAVAEQLQMYSEVIALRKELVVVRDGEARARRQRDSGGVQLVEHDAALDAEIAGLEEAAQRSSLQHVWSAVCEEFPPEMADDAGNWLRLNTEQMPHRLAAARERFDTAQQEADKLYAVQEERINTQTDERDKTKARLEESLHEEMANLEESRMRLQQLQREQRHHIKRGTHVKELHIPQQRRRDVAEGRIHRDENKTFANKFALENELIELTEQVKQSKRILEDNKRGNKKVEVELEKTLKETEENGKEAHEIREKLEKEGDALKGLKQDLQRVLQYVRTRNYAGED